MRPVLLALVSLLTLDVAAQPLPADALPDSVREVLRIELREMMRADQSVRYMRMAGTFSPCEADSVRRALEDLPVADHIAQDRALRAEAAERLTEAEADQLLATQMAVDERNVARLREIIGLYGWPDPTRIGGDVKPFLFLLHTAPDTLDAMLPALRVEVDAGRMPAQHYASSVDKSRKIRGLLQLYGTGGEFDPQTQTVGPPRIASVEETNAARREIGLPPLEAYDIATDEQRSPR